MAEEQERTIEKWDPTESLEIPNRGENADKKKTPVSRRGNCSKGTGTQTGEEAHLRLSSVQVGLDEDLADADVLADFPQRLLHCLPCSQDGHASQLPQPQHVSQSSAFHWSLMSLNNSIELCRCGFFLYFKDKTSLISVLQRKNIASTNYYAKQEVRFIYLLKAYSPVNRTGSPQYKSHTSWIQYKTCTLYTNVKHINIIRKLVHLALLSKKKKGKIKLGDDGTIARFGLAFQYQIIFIFLKNGQRQLCSKDSHSKREIVVTVFIFETLLWPWKWVTVAELSMTMNV